MKQFSTVDYFRYLDFKAVIKDGAIVHMDVTELQDQAQHILNFHLAKYADEFEGKEVRHEIKSCMTDDGMQLGVRSFVS